MIRLKGMAGSMLRCVISEDLQIGDFAASFEEVRRKGEGVLPGAGVVLDFGARALTEETVWRVLSDFVWPSGIEVKAWITYDAGAQDLMKRAGLPTSEPSLSKRSNALRQTLRLDRSLRSGQRVEHPGDVIVVGHINDGAEVFASGSVTVLGRLHGLVHAGAEGAEGESVVARSMEALQVRIAGCVGSLERGAPWWGKPVIVKIEEGSVLIDFWPTSKTEDAKA